MTTANPALSVRQLEVRYPLASGFLGKRRELLAVDKVDLDVYPGEVLGLVGESGCGKSSLGKAIIRLVQPSGGAVRVLGEDFLGLRGSSLRRARARVQMVFQDPYGSLNPRMTVGDLLAEPLAVHGLSSWDDAARIHRVLDQVGLPRTALAKYPHEFSGGQRQRIAIARALILDPQVVIADEPVSSLDVSVQAQILNLLKAIQKERNLALLFVSHNLAVVRYLADRVAVMYLGRVVETGPVARIFESPEHPYTRALLASVPIPDPKLARARKHQALEGELPSPAERQNGCAFASRCPIVTERCRIAVPQLATLRGDAAHRVRCIAAATVDATAADASSVG
mgnify:CR=1 FL=1